MNHLSLLSSIQSSVSTPLSAPVYTDFSALNALSAGNSGLTGDIAQGDQIEEAARQFSSIFLHMALKSMREASFGGGILDSQQSEFYRDMFDQQLALDLSRGEGFGLTQLIVDQLTPNIDSASLDTEATQSSISGSDKAAIYTQVAQDAQDAGDTESPEANDTAATYSEERLALP